MPRLSNRVATYWVTCVSGVANEAAPDRVKRLVGQYGIYAFGERTYARKSIAAGDWICFYATRTGIVAHARVESEAQRQPDQRIENSDRYPYTITLVDICIYTDTPVQLDENTRKHLDVLKGQRDNENWGWLVRSTTRISEGDFSRLTRVQR